MKLGKVYKPQKSEDKIYKMWEKKGYFTPKIVAGKKPFTIIMPPPNANGVLHIGHAVFVTLEDIMIRYHRMKGEPTLWLPGADHGGIATQVVYEKELAKKGKTRFDLGREKFYKETHQFSMENKQIMERQLRKLGASCDWTREKFTLDPKISQSVLFTFKKMYDDGLIYRGKRIINWCPRCQTALSDLEVVYKEKKDPLYYLKYGPLTLATVRPETKFGDTAVAVNPGDKRYQKYIGKEIEIQTVLGKAKIKVIADKAVDPKFGTGVVKVTPGHDPQDFEIGKRHNLEIRQVIGFDNKMNEKAGKYKGLTVLEARKKVAQDLKELGLIEKIDKNYKHRIAICERCKTTIEPLISKQWFVKAKKLAEPAIDAVKNKKIQFIPQRYEKVYFHWLENIRDWCISRQIWWGHQIPVWYKKNLKEEIYVGVEAPKGKGWFRDPDTLDAWFSSGQWPFTTLLSSGRSKSKIPEGKQASYGAGKNQKSKTIFPYTTNDFEYFYPTTVMETGWDILFFWVARMIMLGLYCTGKPPFRYVYLHGLVRDKDRQKMSKSKGNVIDPLGVIDLYGADALRLALVFGTGPGNDVIISEEKIIGQRRFANKIWNAARFVLSQIKENNKLSIINNKLINNKLSTITKADKEILKSLDQTIKSVTKNLDNFQFHQAAETLYHFFWHNFCDKYIEASKAQLDKSCHGKKSTVNILLYVLTTSLKLLHPFMPFLTEQIYQMLPGPPKDALIIENWPKTCLYQENLK